jgi:hypothetical protein
MRNLPLPPRNTDRGDLQKAIRRYLYKGIQRGHDISAVELEEVIALYDRYDSDHAASCDLFKGEVMPQTLRDAIYAAYDTTQEGRRLDGIRELIIKGVDLCPVCGIGPAVELDHFLPRSVFKPLAIFTHNLVPMCHSCNHAKLAGFATGDDRASLHPYYDLLPDVDFLHAHVEIENGGLSIEFSIDLNAALPEGFAGRLDAQMQTLDLNSRYQREVNSYISGHAIALNLCASANGPDGVRDFLQLQARYEVERFYRNHWRPVILGALALHPAFVNGGFATVLPVSQEILVDMNVTRAERRYET